MGNPCVSQPQEVLGCASQPFEVVADDAIGVRVINHPVKADARYLEVAECLSALAGAISRRDDDPEDTLVGQHLEIRALLAGSLITVAEEDSVAGAKCRVFENVNDLAEVRVLDVGNDDADHLGLLASHVPSEAVRSVVGSSYGIQHATSMLLSHRCRAVEYP